jgi:hypothetical protein
VLIPATAAGTLARLVTTASGSLSCSTVGDDGASPRSSQIVRIPSVDAAQAHVHSIAAQLLDGPVNRSAIWLSQVSRSSSG